MYAMINTEADASAMENDLANFQSSCTNTNLLLNTDKFKTLLITRKLNKINHTDKLQDSTLKTTDCEGTLGCGPLLHLLGPNKSSTSVPKPASHLVIFDVQ